MRSMQTDERIESGSKKVRLEGESFRVDQPMPLAPCAKEEISSKQNCHQPPQTEFLCMAVPQRAQCKHYRCAARKKTNAVQNRQFKNLTRSRAAEVLSKIKQVRDHKHEKNSALRDD